MIFYGWGRKSVPLAGAGTAVCSHCGETRAFQIFLNYTYMHLYWIFGAVLRRKYIVACTTCSHGFFLDRQQAREALPAQTANPVPFMQRWGLAVFAAGIALIVCWPK